MGLKELLQGRIDYIDSQLDWTLPKIEVYPTELFQAMRYSVFAGGKRLRPIMLLSACEAVGGAPEGAVPFACAIEMIHTYSLIHDDLPAMDNDDYRRGKLTSHKMFGEDMGILAGDALLHHAMETMAEACCKEFTLERVRAMEAISHGAGVFGMLAGQVVDVLSDGSEINEETLEFIHKNKTAAMIQAALKAGAILGGGTEEQVASLDLVGEKIGVAFQIQDDVLDVISTQNELGKPVHSDEKNKKTTYVNIYGIEKSKKIISRLSKEAIEILEGFGEKGMFLIELTNYLIGRTY